MKDKDMSSYVFKTGSVMVSPSLTVDDLKQADCPVEIMEYESGSIADIDSVVWNGAKFSATLTFFRGKIQFFELFPVIGSQNRQPSEEDENRRLEISRSVLFDAFGEPDETRGDFILYRFDWGTVSVRRSPDFLNPYTGGYICVVYFTQ